MRVHCVTKRSYGFEVDQAATSSFTNSLGERWIARVDGSGDVLVSGDDVGGEWFRIRDDSQIEGGLILADDEFAWLSEFYHEQTGGQLQPTLTQHLAAAMEPFRIAIEE